MSFVKDKNKKLVTLDGVAGATLSFNKNQEHPIKAKHHNPSKQGSQEFRDSITLYSYILQLQEPIQLLLYKWE